MAPPQSPISKPLHPASYSSFLVLALYMNDTSSEEHVLPMQLNLKKMVASAEREPT
jgi:hypothetical protein